MNNDEQARLWHLIKDTKYAMLTHRHADGLLHSHPLTTQNRNGDEDATLYFFIPRDGEIARHVVADPSVNLAYANTDADSYVSIAGRAAMIEDAAKKKALYSPLVKSWFPKGLDDPNLGLLGVQIVDAEYWDVTDSKMVQLFKMAKAAMTGKPPTSIGQHHKVDGT